jgi:hypothetical protein
MLYLGSRYATAAGKQLQFFIVSGRPTVACVKLCDDKEYAGGLEVLIGHTVDAQKLGTAHLEPHRINTMVHHLPWSVSE